MASKKGRKSKNNQLLATLVTKNKAPCAFCQRNVDDEITYGKLYAIGDIQCHYFCVLLSCCLVQKGKDEQGLFGFLYDDIVAEIERSKKHRCSYCSKGGASLGCSVSQCRKQFHVPCGRERDAVSLFYGNYKSFCRDHAPKQKIPEHIMAQARLRRKLVKNSKNLKAPTNFSNLKELCNDGNDSNTESIESVCVICYESVDGFPTLQTFWPPCCARDAWFHRSCLQRMALSAGMHYLKCPLCNDKEHFYEAVVSQGYYVPDRDAAWELEQNAFAEIYERPVACAAQTCLCPAGRQHDADTGMWDIRLCLLCGTAGIHAQCLSASAPAGTETCDESTESDPAVAGVSRYVCATCTPAAPSPQDLDRLAAAIQSVIVSEQSQSRRGARGGPLMPSRMSLRRTKQRATRALPSTSSNESTIEVKSELKGTQNTESSRLDLNLKTPRRPKSIDNTPKESTVLKDIENKLFSPTKLLEQQLYEKIQHTGVKEIELNSKVLERVREKFKKPRPLSAKKRIVNNILDGLFENIFKENRKIKEAVKEWNSPKKSLDIQTDEIKADEENTPPEPENVANIPPEVKTENIDNDSQDFSYTTNVSENDIIKSENIVLERVENVLESIENANKDDKNIEDVNSVVMRDESKDLDVLVVNISGNSNVIEEEHLVIANKETTPSPVIVVDNQSDDSIMLIDTSKKLKTVDIEKDSSLEISANDEVVNIDVVKIEESNCDFIKGIKIKSPVKTKKCSYKFCTDKETLQSNYMNIDLESFKNHYLNEIDKDYKCKFNHKHEELSNSPSKLKTAIDFALDAFENKKPDLKRKLPTNDVIPKKKRKLKKRVPKSKIKVVCNNDKNGETLDLTVATPKTRRRRHKKERSNIEVKIKWRKEGLRLKITKSQMKKAKKREAKLKQYILKYPQDTATSQNVIIKPETDVTPIKRKYTKQEKSPDNLVQTSIQNFFKIKSPAEEQVKK